MVFVAGRQNRNISQSPYILLHGDTRAVTNIAPKSGTILVPDRQNRTISRSPYIDLHGDTRAVATSAPKSGMILDAIRQNRLKCYLPIALHRLTWRH
jgi:hypothetical protein